jgi:hypothetical protein
MLNQSNFIDAWYKPKPAWKQEEMMVDVPMQEAEDPSHAKQDEMAMDTPISPNKNRRKWRKPPKKMPVFAFQKHGVGMDKGRQKRNEK